MNFNIFKILVVVYATAIFFACTDSVSNPGDTRAEFFVRGNCGMCKERIEKAVMNVKGVSGADWNVETKKLTVSYDSTKADLSKLNKAVAKAGHETKLEPAPNEAQNALPSCCKKM